MQVSVVVLFSLEDWSSTISGEGPVVLQPDREGPKVISTNDSNVAILLGVIFGLLSCATKVALYVLHNVSEST